MNTTDMTADPAARHHRFPSIPATTLDDVLARGRVNHPHR